VEVWLSFCLVVEIAVTVVILVVGIPLVGLAVALRLGALFPRFAHRMRVAWVWIVTNIFPRFWRWLEARNLDPVRRFYVWLERDPAEQRGEVDAPR
jgi:hypothetical protein